MYSNLPDGCTDDDIEHYWTGDPVSKDEALERIKEYIKDEGIECDDIDEEAERIFKDEWSFVRYPRRLGGSGYVWG